MEIKKAPVPFRMDEILREKKAICKGKWEERPIDEFAKLLLEGINEFNDAKSYAELTTSAKRIRIIVEELHKRSKKGVVLSKNPILKCFIDEDPYIFLKRPVRIAVFARVQVPSEG